MNGRSFSRRVGSLARAGCMVVLGTTVGLGLLSTTGCSSCGSAGGGSAPDEDSGTFEASLDGTASDADLVDATTDASPEASVEASSPEASLVDTGNPEASAKDSGIADASVSDAALDAEPGDATASLCPPYDGGTAVATSCAATGAGLSNCGATGTDSCCTSLEVSCGQYDRTYTNTGQGPSGQRDQATISRFRLDEYEVTVGRFRQFVTAWGNGTGYLPPAGSGKHVHLNAGLGLSDSANLGGYEPGWQAADDGNVSPTDLNLACQSGFSSWTSSPGSNENLPINCVNWYESYAFCIWDGGFLPSEAEWELAAGGGKQLQFPWGSAAPGTTNQYAIYGCNYGGAGTCSGVANLAPVGSAPLGASPSGQLDLAGNLWEWALDWDNTAVDPYVVPCTDCGYLTSTSSVITSRVERGGGFTNSPQVDLQPPTRGAGGPGNRDYFTGFRCARTP